MDWRTMRLPAAWQWPCIVHHRLQLRGQPRLGPRSLLSFGRRRRTSKAQGYAELGGRSMFMRREDRPIALENENPCQLTPLPRPCSPTQLVTGALHRVKRETGASQANSLDQSGAAPATVSERRIRSTVPAVRHGKAILAGQAQTLPLASPETGPLHSHNKPAVGGRC
ncbi:hypothetical protein EMIT0324P_20505 [Pseudomonas chlororaphis]